jgi:hypothetical protein
MPTDLYGLALTIYVYDTYTIFNKALIAFQTEGKRSTFKSIVEEAILSWVLFKKGILLLPVLSEL